MSDQMLADISTIPADHTVQEAAKLLATDKQGVLAVADSDRLEGLLTASDIMNRVVAQGRNPAETRVREVMSSRPYTCRADDSDRTAMRVMRDHDVKQLPVVDGQGRLLGIISRSAIEVKQLLGGAGD
ncbi:MAG: CBS domain-containing protein [Alphaproteobacteria bacterium]|nr:CBS domain-containing protein [Alphaproteobacteria bacterium]